jgi:single-stranded DNA-binding protein
MATISIAGPVTGREGEPAVTVKTFENGDSIATFSVADRQRVPGKPGQERQGQFYRCEVRGPIVNIVSERLKRGSVVAVSGQLVQRTWNDKLMLDVKYANVTFLDSRTDQSNVSKADIPF